MRRISRKQTKAVGDQTSSIDAEIPTRIFLYLQPKTISYPIEDEDVAVEIELEHSTNTITTLNDHYTPQNIIYLEEFNAEKPTFSIIINQDDIADVTNLSDTPLTLTLYENIARPLLNDSESAGDSVTFTKKTGEESIEEEQELMIIERRPVAQGYVDLLEFFTKTRSRSTCTIFLYPLPTSSHRLTCKMEWEIYSLHPLMKQLIFSNVVFMTFGSIYNMDEQLMDDCEDMTARLSFMSTIPNENMQYDKVPLCVCTAFSKQIIGDQILNYKWENLKNGQIGNEQSMGIMTESKVNIQKLFHDLLRTENVDFNFENIDAASDSALICNSMHRYILSDHMENILEHVLAHNQQRIVVELVREREPDVILLQGFIDLSVFMYPQVFNCSFAIEMRSPDYRKPTLPTPKDNTPKKSNKKGKRRGSASTAETSRRSAGPAQEIPKEKIPFAIIRICLDKPITEPRQDMTHIPKLVVKYQKFVKCPRKYPQQVVALKLDDICEEIYHEFDDTILSIVDYMLRNNIKSIEDDKRFYCSQLGNVTNKILRLVACDFNARQATKTNIEFTNLMTVVYQELIRRVYNLLMKCSSKGIDSCIISGDQIQNIVITRLNIAKYMFEVGNLEIARFVMDKLRAEYLDNPMLNFYLFLYDMEREDFEAAKEYLDKPLKEKYPEGQWFINMMVMYITYKQELLDDNEQFEYAEENLINSLSQYCEHNPTNISTWILLHCLYKKHNYVAGMEYCRWKYENLYKSPYVNLQSTPRSRWDIYMPHKIEFKSNKAQNYYKVVNLFLNLAMYQFAEWIYNEIAIEAMEVEKYFMSNTFKIFLNTMEKKFNTKNFPVEKFLNSSYLRATLSQVNGNLEFFRSGSIGAAMKHYSLICDINDLDSHDQFNLSLLRYSYHMMEEKDYIKAKEAFSLCCSTEEGNCMVAAIGKGKACYRLNDLDEAENAFANSTHYGVYMPNVWAYLALINLKKGENYKALECWKYARLNPDEDIHLEILHELNKINYSDVNLYIDIPDFKSK